MARRVFIAAGGGAVGNLINRILSARGVVDFLDLGSGTARWPTFNVADIGVSVGAVLLAWVLWREESPRGAPDERPDQLTRDGASDAT
ncbi:MAG: signal peptidase II [Gemmatimonadota bacterium]|nr:signal peptidase II [Gemmatimonadota bacterium]